MNCQKNKFKKLILISLIASFAVVISFLFLPLTQAQAVPHCEETFQPSGGLNDGADDGSALKGEDTYISSTRYGDLDTNFGASTELFFDYYWDYNGYPLLKFDVSTLPSDIVSAKLYLFATGNCGGGSCPNMNWTVNAITSTWNEMTATWNTRPTLSGSYGTLNIPASPTGIANARWVSVDITTLYNGWKNGTITNYGIGFTRLGSTGDGGVWFNNIASSDYDTAFLRPKLVIESACQTAPLSPGDIYVVDPSAPGEAGVFKLDSSTWLVTLISSNGYFAEPMGIALSNDGNILIGDPQYPNGSGPGAIFKVDPSTGVQTILSSGNLFTDPRGIAVAANGDIFVADSDAFNYYGGVIKVDPNTGAQTKIYQSADVNAGPLYLAFEANGSLVVSDVSGTSKGVVRVNPTTGIGVQLAAGGNFVYPHGIAVAANGDIFVADNAGKIIKVDPVSGTQTVIASGYPLACPVGLTFDNSGDLLVSDPCNEPGAIIKVNPTTGAANVVANNFGSISPNGIVVVPQPQTCAIPPSGMVSWWPADGNSDDLVGGHNGTLQNGATFASGIVGQAFSFDGVNAVVQVPNNAAWNFGANDFTIDTWVKFNSTSGYPVFVAHDEGGGATNKWVFWLDNGKLEFHVYDTVNAYYVTSNANFTPTLSQWYHIALTRSGNTYKFYVDGNRNGTDQINSNTIPAANAPLTIGKAEAVPSLNGFLDEVEILNRALTSTEIQSLYNAGSFGKCKSTPPADTQPPTITVPAPIVVEATSLLGATVSYDASATDNVGVISFSCSPASGSTFPIGNTVVTCVASDAAGNTANASFTVTVSYNPPPPDSDGDGIPDTLDNCPTVVNPGQEDSDGTPAQNFVSYWKFDEGSGTTAYDTLGTNNGTLVNGPVWTTGKINNGLSLSNGQYVTVPHNSALEITGNLTIAMWVKPNSVTCSGADPAYALLSKRTANNAVPYEFMIGCNGKLRFHYYGTNIQWPNFESTGTLVVGSWQYVAVTRSFSGTNATVTFYINGVASGSSIQATGAARPSSQAVWISRDGYNSGYTNEGTYSGLMDEVAIHNRALTAEEIQQHYQNGLKGSGYLGDSVGDACDNCPLVANPDQADCNNNGIGNTCDAVNPSADDSTCNGIDDNCNGLIDDGYVLTVTSCGVGECSASGQLICQNGVETNTCAPKNPTAEICDNLDNDCNGSVDENLTQSCYSGPDGTEGVGVCLAGTQTCSVGNWGSCTSQTLPSTETCDNLDNDCNGFTDENLGFTTCGVGQCQQTVQNCVYGTTQVCTPGAPSAETCDNLDNNCNGQTDEELTESQSCGLGVCAGGTQTKTCTTGNWCPWGECSTSYLATAEICDGKDNNCDGVVDEGFDMDLDGIADCFDNCPTIANPDQADSDITNIALGKSVSSPFGTFSGSLVSVTDGDLSTYWSPSALGNNYVIVDLGSSILPAQIKAYIIYINGPYPGTGTVELSASSDGSSYTIIYADSFPLVTYGSLDKEFSVTDISTSFRYLKVRTTAVAAGFPQPVRYKEVKVYQTDGIGDVCDVCPLDIYNDADTDGVCLSEGDCNDNNPAIYPGATEVCDGLDNDCDGVVDDNLVAPLCSLQQGVCAGSTKTCGGVVGWLACDASNYGPNYELVETKCDNLDNNCDGSIDGSLTQSCYTGPSGTEGKGICTGGTQTCSAGIWGSCTSQVLPSDEVCDNKDNDCDGSTDEDLTRLTTCGVGACSGNTGIETCTAGTWGNDTCDPYARAAPNDATCNGIDEDCDSAVDEDYIPTSTSCGLGVCASSGLLVCQAGSTVDTCTSGTPTTEICDNLDNDCDGSIADDGEVETWYNQPTSCGIGQCTATGNLICSGGSQVNTCAPGTPTAEVCDGKDNNCNNQIDDGIANVITDIYGHNNIGQCKVQIESCVNGSFQIIQTAIGPSNEACDNLDNDCDGSVDENLVQSCYTGPARTQGVGVCKAGIQTCSAGIWGSCTGQILPSIEIKCNNIDDDCNPNTLDYTTVTGNSDIDKACCVASQCSPFINHGQYVSCVANARKIYGYIPANNWTTIQRIAAQSNIGNCR